MAKMRIAVIGCTKSTKRFVEEIIKNPELEIIGILTLKDEDAGKKSRFTPLDGLAKSNNIYLYKVDKINSQKTIALMRKLNPDLILESGWSQIIPKEILRMPKKGCIGIHNSYLPKNQGAASINWALIKGEKKWGVTLFYLEEKIDDGDIIDQREYNIDDKDDVNALFDKADALAAEMLRKNLPLIKEGKAPRKKQNKEEATYLPRRKPEDGRIDWGKTNIEIYNLVRALTKPYPGAFTFYKSKKLFVWECEKTKGFEAGPGAIAKIHFGKGIAVGTGSGSILIKRAQFSDGIEMRADDLAEEYKLKESDKFD